MNKNWTAIATACVMTLALTACGGGGSDGGGSTTPAAESTQTGGATTQVPAPTPAPTTGTGSTAVTVASPFLGTWKRYPDHYCTDNWAVVPASMNSQRGVMPVEYVFTESTMAYTHNIYADTQCTQLLGSVTLTTHIQWEAASVSGWTDAARVQVSYASFKTTGNITVDESEARAEFAAPADKSIFGVKAAKLYLGDRKTLDVNGYPTAFRADPSGYQ